jgi:predicted enzyme related to lactoylglutathione lyase
MVRVDDLDDGIAFYERAFGTRLNWRDESSAGLGLPETDAEIVLHTMDDIPAVHYLVDDVDVAVEGYVAAGASVRVAPFDIPIGRCAVLADPYGNPVCVLDIRRPR